MKTWSASLSNESCIFDVQDGFETLREAINWALNRGGDYVIHIDDAKDLPGLHLCMSSGKLWFERGYQDWIDVNIDDFCKEYG